MFDMFLPIAKMVYPYENPFSSIRKINTLLGKDFRAEELTKEEVVQIINIDIAIDRQLAGSCTCNAGPVGDHRDWCPNYTGAYVHYDKDKIEALLEDNSLSNKTKEFVLYHLHYFTPDEEKEAA